MRLVNLSPPYSTLRPPPPKKNSGARNLGTRREITKRRKCPRKQVSILGQFGESDSITSLASAICPRPLFAARPSFFYGACKPIFFSPFFARKKGAVGGAAQQRPLKIPYSWAATLFFRESFFPSKPVRQRNFFSPTLFPVPVSSPTPRTRWKEMGRKDDAGWNFPEIPKSF